jgi:hypothetical protein
MPIDQLYLSPGESTERWPLSVAAITFPHSHAFRTVNWAPRFGTAGNSIVTSRPQASHVTDVDARNGANCRLMTALACLSCRRWKLLFRPMRIAPPISSIHAIEASD